MQNDLSTQPAAPESEPVPSVATGPRTEAGKAISSQNAREHGLCSRTLRLSPEESIDYNELRECYARDLQPADGVEQTLVDEICFNYWRLQQAREAELEIIQKHSFDLAIIALYIRYRTGYERAFYKALDQVQKLQRDRRKQTNSAPASLAAVRSAESEASPADVPLAPTSLASVRSADSVSAEIQSLTRQLEQHIAESRVRSAKSSGPIPLPAGLADGLDRFVSQYPDALPKQLVEILKKVA